MRTALIIFLIAGAILTVTHACKKPLDIEPAPLQKESISAEFVVAKQHLYMLMQNKITIYNVTNEAQPVFVTEFSVNVQQWEQAEKITSNKDHLFIIASSGAYVYDISTPQEPSYKGYVQGLSSCASFAIEDTLVYIITDTCKDRSRSFIVKNIEEGWGSSGLYGEQLDSAKHISITDSLVFISLGAGGISFRVSDTAFAFNEVRVDATLEADAILPMKDNNIMLINSGGFHQYSYDTSLNLNFLSNIPITR